MDADFAKEGVTQQGDLPFPHLPFDLFEEGGESQYGVPTSLFPRKLPA
jgi:hypothetical protein